MKIKSFRFFMYLKDTKKKEEKNETQYDLSELGLSMLSRPRKCKNLDSSRALVSTYEVSSFVATKRSSI